MRNRLLLSLVAVLALFSLAAAKDVIFAMPRPFHAKTYPAHEVHTDEKLTIAADPYDMADKTLGVFSFDYKSEGLLPILLIISNDGDDAVTLSGMKVLLVTRNRTKISPSRSEDIFRRISHKKEGRNLPIPNPLPIPLPKKSKRMVSKEAEAEVGAAQFMARAAEPHSNKVGFLFFDVAGISNPLAGARLVITGLANSQGDELFYFEIPLEKYLGYEPLKPTVKPNP